MLSVQHNMMAMNAGRQFNITTKAKEKKMEKLSSGYRVNRSADDAAGLSISEKMRRQIRGLKVGTENAQMGISWVQIGEGALNEAHDILHRMNELSIKAQNGTNTLTDRAYMEAEFEQLQSELDRISTTTTFNELNIFEEHEPVYDQISGNILWDYEEYHDVTAGKNQLTIAYRNRAESEAQVMTITVPPGRYTTHELIDEIDDAFGVDSPIHMEFTEKGFCRLNLEDGEVMDAVTGGLTYLMWDNYDGGGYGTLIGTTEFMSPTDTLEIVDGQNNRMWVEVESFDPDVGTKGDWINLLKSGETSRNLTKAEIMQRIDEAIAASSELKDTGLKTGDHGLSIQLFSPDGIVTGFKGNMFKIENSDPIYSSAFYDNIQHGYVWQDPASVVGEAVLTTDVRDEEHNRFYINSSNNTLVLNPNPTTNSVKTPITITIPTKAANASDPTKEGYTAQEMVAELNKIFDSTTGLKGEVKAYLVRSNSKVRDPYPDGKNPGGKTATKESVGDDNLIFEGIEIRTVKEGPDAIVNIDKDASTAYDTLFTIKKYNKYGTEADKWDATVANEKVKDYNGYSLGQSSIPAGGIKFTSANNRFNITLRSTSDRNKQFDNYPYATSYDFEQTFTVNVGTGTKNLDAIITAINNDLANKEMVVGKDKDGNDIKVKLNTRIKAEKDGNYIKIVDNEDLTLDNANDKYPNWYTQIDVSSYGANAGYRILFQRKENYVDPKTYTYNKAVTLTVPTSGMKGNLSFSVNGQKHTIYGSNGKSAAGVKALVDADTPNTFSTVKSVSETKPQNFTVEGSGTTTHTYWAGGSAQGQSKKYQGRTGFEMNTPAELEIGPTLSTNPVVVDNSSNKITLGLNGTNYTFTIANSAGSAFDKNNDGRYSQAELEEALQDAIDRGAGEGFGGAVVEIKSNRIVITSRLGTNDDGSKTSITSYAQGQRTNTFFDSLVRSETGASCTTTMNVKSGISMTDGLDDTFEFSYTGKDGISHNVSLDLMKGGETSPTNIDTLVSRITTRLTEEGLGSKVKVEKNGSKLKLSTKETGANTHIEYTTGPVGSTKANATAIFGDIDTGVKTTPQAKITLNCNLKASATFSGEKTFKVKIDGVEREVKIRGGWTSMEQLKNKLNNGPNGNDGLKSMGVTASISNNRLVLTRDATTGTSSLEMSYNSGGTVMQDMFGTSKKSSIDGVTITASGSKLTITAGANDVIIIDSDESGGTLKGKDAVRYWDHVRKQGFHSAKFSTVTSVDLKDYVKAGGIELNKWNNELEFKFTENGTATPPTWKTVSFRLTESGAGNKTSIANIVSELQTKIDNALGTGKIEVLFDTNTNKLSLKSAKPGAQFQFDGLESKASGGVASADATNKIGGGFYHHVMCKSEEQTIPVDDPTDINGDQFPGDIFAQGRHDVVIDRASLHPNISDTLILDLNYVADEDHNGKLSDAEKKAEKKITLTLHPATKAENWLSSSSDEVLKTLREQIKEAIKDWNTTEEAKNMGIQLHEDLIEVDIGRHDTGIWGNKDKVAISFTMTKNPDIATPVEGYFYIDGIRGNAAYETFYYTEGELIPAFIEGTKDIRDGVVLGEDDNELAFLVDDELKTIDLSKLEKGRKYSAEEIVQTIADEFKAQDLPLAVSLSQKGNLRISYKTMGMHRIEQVSGSARDILFFEEHADRRLPNERAIRVSSQEGDRIEVYSPRFSTAMLGINSICISTVKNAEKATNRLKEAISKVSEMRSTFGSIQNRIEHTINNNRNKEENTQAAESRIRDTDIAKEMVDFSNLNIIQQAGQAVLAQANQGRDGLLALLT